MNGYALVNNGLVVNTVLWDGVQEVDFESMYGKGVIAIEIKDGEVVSPGYSYKDGVYTPPPLTDEQIAQQKQKAMDGNISYKNSLMSEASQRISVLQDAVDLEMATDEEKAALPLWKKYRVLLSRVDSNTSDTVSWPEKPAF